MRRLVLIAAIGLVGLVPAATSANPKSPALGAPRIVYASDWSGTDQIYSVDPSGRTPTALIATGGRPIPSPDGARLLFWRGYRLLVARADGSGQRLIHAFSKASQYYLSGDPAWAADSRRFAYVGADGVHVANANGSHDRSVAAGWAPAWSPDGRSLTFNTTRGIEFVGPGGAKLITNSPSGPLRYSSGTAWSPTGKWIAYTTNSDKVTLVSPDGRVHRTLGDGIDPAWSPNGRMVAFGGRDGVEVVNIASGKIIHISGYFAGWSPDGRTLAVRAAGGYSTPIDLVDAKTGAAQTRLSDNGGYVYWSPGGREFAYLALANGSGIETGFDLRVGSISRPTATVVAAAGDYGGNLFGWAWTRPPAGTRFRPAPLRSIATASANQLTAPWAITRLAADGDRVAYVSCGHVFVWTPTSGVVVQAEPIASMSPACNLPGSLPGSGSYTAFSVYDLALAGDRVAYGFICCNSAKSWSLSERSLVTPVRSYRLGGGSYPDDVGESVGSGSLLVFSSWQSGYAADGHEVTTQQTILRASPTGCGDCPALRTDPGPLIPDDVDMNRIAAHGDNAVVILDAGGTQLLSVPVKALATALSGSDLVVLVQGELRDYNARDGTLLRQWPLPDVPIGNDCGPVTPPWPCNDARARLRLEDATRGLAIYVLDDDVHLLRLADGTDTTIGPGTYARFMDAGLVYADGSRLHLVPYSQLPLA